MLETENHKEKKCASDGIISSPSEVPLELAKVCSCSRQMKMISFNTELCEKLSVKMCGGTRKTTKQQREKKKEETV